MKKLNKRFQTLIPAAGVKVQQSEAGVVEPQNIDGYKVAAVLTFAVVGIYTAVKLVDKLCGVSVVINADNRKVEELVINQRALNHLGDGLSLNNKTNE